MSQSMSKDTLSSRGGESKQPGAWRGPSQGKERKNFLVELSEPRCQSLNQTPLQPAHPSLLIKDNAALQGRLLLLCCQRVLHILLLCCCSLRTNVHVLRTRVGLQQKQNVRGPPLLFSPTPSDSPVQATKHTQARQPLGRHRKEPLLLWFQTSVLIN